MSENDKLRPLTEAELAPVSGGTLASRPGPDDDMLRSLATVAMVGRATQPDQPEQERVEARSNSRRPRPGAARDNRPTASPAASAVGLGAGLAGLQAGPDALWGDAAKRTEAPGATKPR